MAVVDTGVGVCAKVSDAVAIMAATATFFENILMLVWGDQVQVVYGNAKKTIKLLEFLLFTERD